MENPTIQPDEPIILPQGETATQPVSPRKRVGFFGVLIRLIVALAVLAGAAYFAKQSVENKPETVKRQARERSFTVAVKELSKGNYSPTINAYGEIVAANKIDIRSQVSGTALRVSQDLAVGAYVQAGAELLQIDPYNYELGILDAQATLSDARIQLGVEQEQMRIEQVNLDVSRSQLELAETDLARLRELLANGSTTKKAIEDSDFQVTQRRQSVAQHESNIAVQKAGLKRQGTAILRADANVQLAERSLANTVIEAPFDAVVLSAGVVRGGVISQNEVVAQLYERDKLDVRFTLSDKQYGQLLSAGLVGREIEVSWDIDPAPLVAQGKVTRAGAQVNAALGGVEIFARLDGDDLDKFRAGAFVSVRVAGLEYRDVFEVPETAIYENNHLYVVNDGRMARVDLTILARAGAQVIVQADIAADARVILTRVAQAGQGLKVRIEGEAPAFGPGGPGGGKPGAKGRPEGGPNGQGSQGKGAQGQGTQGKGSGDKRPQGDGAGNKRPAGENAGANSGAAVQGNSGARPKGQRPNVRNVGAGERPSAKPATQENGGSN